MTYLVHNYKSGTVGLAELQQPRAVYLLCNSTIILKKMQQSVIKSNKAIFLLKLISVASFPESELSMLTGIFVRHHRQLGKTKAPSKNYFQHSTQQI